MLLYFVVGFLLFFFKYYGNKKGFDKLETYWLIYFTIFWIVFSKLKSAKNRLIFTLTVLNIKALRLPLITFMGILLSIYTDKFSTYRLTSLYIFKNLGLKINLENMPQRPTIMIANYPTNYIEYLCHGLFGDKVCLLLHGAATKIVKHIYGQENIIPVEKGNYDIVQKKVQEKLEQGYHIFSYIERDYYNRPDGYSMTEFRTGMFSIALNLKTSITPVVIDHIEHFGGMVANSVFNVRIGPTEFINSVADGSSKCRKFMEKELKRMKIKKLIVT